MKDKKRIIGSIAILCAIAIISMIYYFSTRPSKKISENEIFAEESNAQTNDEKYITVYINGEVKNPKVYRMKDGSIMDDLVREAGGFTQNADMDRLKLQLNLALKLRDGDHIYIYSKNDSGTQISSSSQLSSSEGGKVNLNTATKDELKTVPGIGDVTAQKIIDFREKNGGFKTIDDLKKIDRIGEKTFEKFKDKVDIR
jgi:competence protein ComEA